MRQLYLSAASKSSGKTTLSIGLSRALRDRGRQVQPFKKGPDYIDPMWLGLATGRLCYNLDFYTCGAEEIRQIHASRSAGADLVIIEGNKGLYDGMDLEGSDSNAAMAKLLGAPVVLVLDTQGSIRGVAPLLLGYRQFDPGVAIAGVILNKVGGSRHEAKLRAVVERYTDIPVFGAVHRHPELALDERHLGLIPSNEHLAAEARIAAIAAHVAEQVDLDALAAVGREPPAVSLASTPTPQAARGALRIGVLRDRAFGFYYPDDLEALERSGAQLIPVDALSDTRLPPLDGLFIGGGFPETHMQELEANAPLRAEIGAAIAAGLPAYAECGGLMYLCRSLRWGERSCAMVGTIDADCLMLDRPQGRGYARFVETEASPWPQPGQGEIAAHEFHYSRLLAPPPGARYAYRVTRGCGIDGSHDGLVIHNLLASYLHRRNTCQDPWAGRFVNHVRNLQQRAVSSRRPQAR